VFVAGGVVVVGGCCGVLEGGLGRVDEGKGRDLLVVVMCVVS
jgi:hypothetical protein